MRILRCLKLEKNRGEGLRITPTSKLFRLEALV